MNLQTLFNYFRNIMNDGVLELVAEDQNIFQKLLNNLNTKSLLLRNCKMELFPTNNPKSLNIIGKASISPLNTGIEFEIFLTCFYDNGNIEYTFYAVSNTEMSFKLFFGELYPSKVIRNGMLELEESEIKDVTITNPTISISMKELEENRNFQVKGRLSFENCKGKFIELIKNVGKRFEFLGELSLYDQHSPMFSLKIDLLESFEIKPGFIGSKQISKLIHNDYVKLGLFNATKEIYDVGTQLLSGTEFLILLAFDDYCEPIEASSEYLNEFELGAKFDNGLGIGDVVNFFSSIFGSSPDNLLVPTAAALNTFKLYSIMMGTKKEKDSLKLSIEYINAVLASSREWNLLPFLTINNMTLCWEIQWGQQLENGKRPFFLTGQITSYLQVGLFNNKKLDLKALIELPSFDIYAGLKVSDEESSFDMSDIIGESSADIPSGNKHLPVAEFELFASYQEATLDISARFNNILTFDIGNITINLEEVVAGATFMQGGNSYKLGGTINFAGNREDSENNFGIALEGTYSDATWDFTGRTIGQVNIGALITEFIGVQYVSNQTFLEIVLSEFEIRYTYKKNVQNKFSLTAAFQMGWGKNIFQSVEVSNGGKIVLSMEKDKKTSLFAMLDFKIGGFHASAQVNDFYSDTPTYIIKIGYKDKYIQGTYYTENKKELITISLENTTLGDIVTYIIGFINPNKKFELSSPWDVLHKVDLSKLKLKMNLTDKLITFSYNIGINIPGIAKVNEVGIIYNYGNKNGLKENLRIYVSVNDEKYDWDAIDGSPPDILNNQKKFELNYLGMAQHFSNDEIKNAMSIEEAANKLIATMTPPKEGELPIAIKYDPETNWLFGADFKINSALRARIVLNDPVLYGLQITVDGDNAPFAALKGLMLELLYKKITKDIGMFKATLVLPEKYRHFDLGAVSITIGIVSLEIYTNGNFLIDLGFPHNNNFDRSFGVSFGIYTGRGGLYFGSLSGATCSQLPKTDMGTFNPVITMGLGVSFGFGKSFNFGIVSGGFSVEVFGIFEGLFATYHPHNGSSGSLYYKVEATIGIIGRAFLKVDFKIISINASLDIIAYAKAVLESYKAMNIHLSLALEMNASVKIAFIKVKFKFRFNQSFSFTIGSDQTPPWITRRSARSLPQFQGKMLMKQAVMDKKYQIRLMIDPIFSLAEDNENKVNYCIAFLPTITMEDYKTFAEMLAKWVLYRFGTTVSWEFGSIMTPELLSEEITYPMLFEFMEENLLITLAQSDLSDENQTETDGAVFPMLPPVELHFKREIREEEPIEDPKENPEEDAPENPPKVIELKTAPAETQEDFHVAYYKDNLVSESYTNELKEYFKSFETNSAEEENDTAALYRSLPKPLAETIFTDYIHMVIKQIVSNVSSMFAQHKIDSRNIGEAKAKYGVSPVEILRNNPSLRIKNERFTVPEKSLVLSRNDSIASICSTLGISIGHFIKNVGNIPDILRQDTSFILSHYKYKKESSDLKLIAALFYTRWFEQQLDVNYQNYVNDIYTQIFEYDTNQSQSIDIDWECDGSVTFTISLSSEAYHAVEWKMCSGDTAERIAKMWAVYNMKTGENIHWDQFLTSVVEMNAETSSEYIYLPESELVIHNDQTLLKLMNRVYPDQTNGDFHENPLLSITIFKESVTISMRNVWYDPKQVMELTELMNQYDLTFDELATSLERGSNSLKFVTGQEIILKDLETIPRDEILAEITGESKVSDLAAITSRFLLQGLRLPRPYNQDDSGDSIGTEAYYKLLMQQTEFEDDGYGRSLTVLPTQEECTWIIGEINLTMDADTIQKLLPDKEYKWDKSLHISDKPLVDSFISVPKFYSVFENRIMRQTAGNRTLFKFNQDLTTELNKVRELKLMTQENQEEIPYQTALLLSVKLGIIENCPNLYSLYGLDSKERLILERFLSYYGEEDKFEHIACRLLYSPSALSGTEDSLIEVDLKPADTVIIKTNLSKETHMFPVLSRTLENYKGSFEQENEFLRLLWECSVVGGGGYYLSLNTPDGSTLPEDIFDETSLGSIYLFLEDIDQSILKDSGVANYGFCEGSAQVETPVCFYEADESNEELKIWQPALPIGNYAVKFTMDIPPEEQSEEHKMEEMFNIFSYKVSFDGTLEDKKDSKPLIPLSTDETLEDQWQYMPVLPLYKLYDEEEKNPYRVLGKKAGIYLYCRDILGNYGIGENPYVKICDIIPKYNDYVIGANEWPGIQSVYSIEKINKKAYINYELEFKGAGELEPSMIARFKLSILQLEEEYVRNSYCPVFVNSSLFRKEIAISDTNYKQLITYLYAVLYCLENGSGVMPEKLKFAFPISESDTVEKIFPLTASIIIRRNKYKPDIDAAVQAISNISPNIIASSDDELEKTVTIQDFTRAFEEALPSFKLASSGENDTNLQVIRFGEAGAVKKIRIKTADYGSHGIKAPKYYALRPLSNSFISRTVMVNAFKDLGDYEKSNSHVFTNIDLDIWAKRFLTDYEYFLSDGYAGELANYDTGEVNRLISIKEKLAEGIARQLIYIGNEKSKSGAYPVRLLKDRLKRSLTSAYRIASIAEYDMEFSCSDKIRLTTTVVNKNEADENNEAKSILIQSSKLDSSETTFCIIYEAQNPNETGFAVDLGMSVNELEYGISGGRSGYESSNWLKFINPITEHDVNPFIEVSLHSDILVPNPLRNCPQIPELTEHKQQEKEFRTSEELHIWDYNLSCSLEAAEQDTYNYEIRFADDMLMRSMLDQYRLFDALAQYEYVRDELLESVKTNCDLLPKFIDLAQNIADAWNSALIQSKAGRRVSPETLNCTVRLKEGSFLLDPVSDDWDVSVQCNDKVISGENTEFSLLVNNLNLYTKHSVEPSLKTVRNQNILQAGNTYLDVNPIFIYQTEPKTLNRIYIANRSRQEFNLGNVGEKISKKSILNALNLLYEKLAIEEFRYTANLVIWYSYTLDERNNRITIKLPVSMYNEMICTDLKNNQRMVESIYNWFMEENPEELNNALLFDITIYTPYQKLVLMDYNNLKIDFGTDNMTAD